ncbi:MAG: MFS transporter [Paludibacter sp.]|nr:MFS transporter [Paludibacter sp.]
MQKEILWTKSFISACIGNFLLFFAFYLLVPVFPLYLIEKYDASKALVGVILSSYTIAALLIRPFAGFVLDMLYRRPLYLAAYVLFVLTFVGYPLAHTIGLFLFFRILHGFTFGFVTTAGNSLIIDIMPASRRGEGLGYFGIANNLAMAVGPMAGLMLHDVVSFDFIFYTAIATGLIGFVFATNIKSENLADKRNKQPVAFDRFFLFKGLNAGFSLLLMGIPYGMAVTYISLYGRQVGLTSGIGMFFSLMAVGLTFSRLFGGKMVDKGKVNAVINWGTLLCVIGFAMLTSLHLIAQPDTVLVLFYVLSLILGLGYGLLFPAYNTVFVNLAPNNRRATASSTYMTSWDIGIGIGLVAGGWIADNMGGLQISFLAGTIAVVLSLLFFLRIAGPHYMKNKLR